jgi:ubiquinone/menaquinone biosynthesis C-methylase UbiE
MQIHYQETTSDLLTRIDIHKKYGGRDIDQWMLATLQMQKGAQRGIRILDVGCGAGKQCFVFHKALGGECEITGGDVNAGLLAQARAENAKIGSPVTFTELDFNERFPFDDDQFDLASCCFAIYYARDIPFTIREMHRVIRPGGRLFTSGPMPDNKKLFYDVIREATDNKPVPPMPGSSRYGSQILAAVQATFARVEVHSFENPLTFHEVEPFVAYTRASLNEDRKIWGSFFDEKDTFESVMSRIGEAAARRLAREGELVMTKVVGGFVAYK